MPSFTPFSPNAEGKQAERLRKFLESNVQSTRDRGPTVSRWTLPSNLTQVSTFYIPSHLITFPACQRTCFLCHNRYNCFQEGAGLPVLVCPNVVMFAGVRMEIVGIVNVCACGCFFFSLRAQRPCMFVRTCMRTSARFITPQAQSTDGKCDAG